MAITREILISIQSQWVEKILNGEKTIEIRKTMPKCELPVKVYIYCSKNKGRKELRFLNSGYGLNGKVVAEFTLNKINKLDGADAETEKNTCLTMGELFDYAKGKLLYAWHINDLKIYSKPKQLADFGLKKAPQSWKYVNKE